jgi:hypothetical protein
MHSALVPVFFKTENPEPESRCCFCYGLFEAGFCYFADQRKLHRACLPVMLKALEHPDLELHLPDGKTELIQGYQSEYA